MPALLLLILLLAAPASAQTFSCESGGEYRECRIGSAGVAVLVRELSVERACFEGVTYGTRQGGVVWVSRGCRAVFTVATENAPTPIRKDRVICESQDGAREVCRADVSEGVALGRQLSRAVCVRGVTWDYEPERNLIWVDRGCRAEFLLGRPAGDSAPPPPALDTLVTCESTNGRRKDCAADTTGGVQFVRRLDERECSFGRDWGYDAKSIWVSHGCRAEFATRGGKPRQLVRAVICESIVHERSHCEAETRYGVALVRELEGESCIFDRTWGFDATGVWVTEGCRAQFALGGYRLPPTAVPPTAARLTCESKDGQRTHCPATTSRGVGLIRQLSETDCVLNRTWGYGPDGIWVTSGCRAEFAVAK